MGANLLLKVPLRWRLALGHAALLGVVTALLGLFVVTTLERDLLREADETLAIRAGHVARVVAEAAAGPLDSRAASAALRELAPLEEFSAPGIYVEVFDGKGTLLTASPNLPGGHLPGEALVTPTALAGEELYATIPVGPEQVRVLARPVRSGNDQIGVVMVGESLHAQGVALWQARQLLTLLVLGAIFLSLLGSWWLSGGALRTVSEVTRVARRIAATGKFEQRIEHPQTRDEVGELAATFNQMLGALEDTFRRHRQFLADASHELRGPLMVVRGNLELLRHELPAPERQESASEAMEEAERMSRLLSDLLFLAKNDAQVTIDRAPVNLSEVVLEKMNRAVALDAGRHVLVVSHSEPAWVLGDRERLGQMVWNLLDNALRYTPEAGEISVSLRKFGELAEIAVADTGTGIAPEHLPRIFERFYRADPSRTRRDGGAGLGLAIVQQVAELHGGQVAVRSQSGAGSTFTVSLPLTGP